MRDISDIKAAVVGTGFIGVVHVEALRGLGVEVTGVVGSSPERAAEAIAFWAVDHPGIPLARVADHLMAVLWPVVRELPSRR